MSNNSVFIVNARIDNLTFDEALDRFVRLIQQGKPYFAVTPNVDHIVKLRKDPEFRKVYDASSLTLADGMPLLWAAKFLGTPIKEKISGSDFVPGICRVAMKNNYRIFLFGGRQGAAEKAAEFLTKSYPGINIVGTYCPPFGFEKNEKEDQKAFRIIKEASPDILLVGLGAPKQEKWIYKHYRQLEVPISMGVGVTFEFLCGMVMRAPVWIQKTGIEWFWRLIMEPCRLWKRYLIDDPVFFWLVLKQKLGMK